MFSKLSFEIVMMMIKVGSQIFSAKDIQDLTFLSYLMLCNSLCRLRCFIIAAFYHFMNVQLPAIEIIRTTAHEQNTYN